MPTYDVRDAICEIGRRVWQRGYVAANDGNFSYRLDEDTVLATPTRVSKGFLEPADLVLLDLDGNHKGGLRRGTSEIRVHLNAYRQRPDIRSVVHVHPPHATAFAVAGRALPKGVLEETDIYLGEVPLIPYETTGTWEFARSLDPWIETHDAFLLSNHGALTFGADPFDAYYRMEVLDHSCKILLHALQLGGWRHLEPAHIEKLAAAKERHGFADPREGLPFDRWTEDVVLPRRAASKPAHFDAPPFDGRYPLVSDEPKPPTTPRPAPAEEP